MLTSRLVYKAVLETLGSGYEPFRLLSGGAVLLTGALFFAYASRRVGKLAAFAPTLILLVFGSDPCTCWSATGSRCCWRSRCGLGALLALDRGDRRGDLAACALLCLGVLTYTVALPFVVGAAVVVLLRDDRWRRIWITLAPVALYAIWWLWALGRDARAPATSSVLVEPALGPELGVPGAERRARRRSPDSITASPARRGLGHRGCGRFARAWWRSVALGWRLSRGRCRRPWGSACDRAQPLGDAGDRRRPCIGPPTRALPLPRARSAVLLVAVEATRGIRVDARRSDRPVRGRRGRRRDEPGRAPRRRQGTARPLYDLGRARTSVPSSSPATERIPASTPETPTRLPCSPCRSGRWLTEGTPSATTWPRPSATARSATRPPRSAPRASRPGARGRHPRRRHRGSSWRPAGPAVSTEALPDPPRPGPDGVLQGAAAGAWCSSGGRGQPARSRSGASRPRPGCSSGAWRPIEPTTLAAPRRRRPRTVAGLGSGLLAARLRAR